MDLRSMLNDSGAAQKEPPRLHTPQSSYDGRSDPPRAYDPVSERPTPLPVSSHSIDSRSTGPGGYFNVQSPHPPTSASTPSGGAPSVYAQSPGAQVTPYAPRDGNTPYGAYPPGYVASPVPVTPGSVYHHGGQPQAVGTSHPNLPHAIGQQLLHRQELSHLNGNYQAQERQMSPPAPINQAPATPLGPPPIYPRQSLYSGRPPSQGYDQMRRTSIGSASSTHSRDYGALSQPELQRGGIQRNYSGASEDLHRERERSIESVSPKTIPKPPPQRQSSVYSQSSPVQYPQPGPPNIQHPHRRMSEFTQDRQSVGSLEHAAQNGNAQPHQHPVQATPSNSAFPDPHLIKHETPQSETASVPIQPSPSIAKKPNLKRNASVVSNVTPAAMPPRKRIKRDEIPLFARSARHGRPLRLNVSGPQQRPHRVHHNRPRHQTPDAQQPPAVRRDTVVAPSAPNQQFPWEASISNIQPYEDTSRLVCDWVVQHILDKVPPVGGVFEIEAKIGNIVLQEDGIRLHLPVLTETVFDKNAWKPTKFASTMQEAQHAQLNQFLNKATQDAAEEPRIPIYYSHPKESDEFWELTDEGRRALPQSLTHYINPRHKVKVRKTFVFGNGPDQGSQKQSLIKIRIADLDIYNPKTPFDFRISISLEYNWNGPPEHLAGMVEGGKDRQKDRMSYKHLGYQIDLTQVRHPGSNDKEHELEIEVSTPMLQAEMEKVRSGQPNQYEELIRGLLDNLRLLSRTAAA